MTNFEWLMTLSEEEFTDWVYDQWLHHLQYRWSSSRGGLMIWLKEERAEQSEPKTYCKKKNCVWWSTSFTECLAEKNGLKCKYKTEQTEPQTCDTCKYGEDKHRYAHICNECGVGINNYEPKTEPNSSEKPNNCEPQTDCAWK